MLKHARISESDYVCNIEDEGKHDDGNESVKVMINQFLDNRWGNLLYER